MRCLALGSLLCLSITCVASAQEAQPLDGPNRLFQDSLVERLAGDWVMIGTVRQKPVTYRVHAEWLLNHQFLKLAMVDTAKPAAYEAHVYIGRDHTSERYVAHWLDIGGGRWSETLGYGTRTGNAIEVVFEYPDGPFHTTFTWDGKKGWSVLMRERGSTGEWKTFGQWTLRR